jgi:aspartate/methionine/tyrosine aminotransferase
MAWARAVQGTARLDLTASGMADSLGTRAHMPDGLTDPWSEPLDLATLCRRDMRPAATEAYCQTVADRYGVPAAHVVPTLGASLAITHVLLALLRSGDHVVVERPTYEPLHRVPEILGADVSRLERKFEESWAVVPDRLARLLSSRTKVVILSNLHNPSGVAIDRDALGAVTELAARVGALVLVDEVYLDYAFDARDESPVVPACRVADNCISWSSTTKCFGFSALRAGWIVAGNRAVADAIARATDYLYVDAPISTLSLGQRVLAQADNLQAHAAEVASAGRAIVTHWLETERRVRWVSPHAGLTCCLRLPDLMHDGPFVGHLREKYDTQVVPGTFFEAPGFVRLGFGVDPADLTEALAHFSAALDDLL